MVIIMVSTNLVQLTTQFSLAGQGPFIGIARILHFRQITPDIGREPVTIVFPPFTHSSLFFVFLYSAQQLHANFMDESFSVRLGSERRG